MKKNMVRLVIVLQLVTVNVIIGSALEDEYETRAGKPEVSWQEKVEEQLDIMHKHCEMYSKFPPRNPEYLPEKSRNLKAAHAFYRDMQQPGSDIDALLAQACETNASDELVKFCLWKGVSPTALLRQWKNLRSRVNAEEGSTADTHKLASMQFALEKLPISAIRKKSIKKKEYTPEEIRQFEINTQLAGLALYNKHLMQDNELAQNLEWIIKNGGRVDSSKNNFGVLPLVAACQTPSPRLALIEMLLKYGADPDQKDSEHHSAWSMSKGKDEVRDLLAHYRKVVEEENKE